MIPMARLRGLSVERAELYGKPHVGARYTGGTPRSYELTSTWCCVCGRPSANCHHAAPLRSGGTFLLTAPIGSWTLRSSLIGLCGSGTTGCHGGFHSGRYSIRWAWDSEQNERWWWDGALLKKWGPHSPELYAFGRWQITDRDTGRVFEIRED